MTAVGNPGRETMLGVANVFARFDFACSANVAIIGRNYWPPRHNPGRYAPAQHRSHGLGRSEETDPSESAKDGERSTRAKRAKDPFARLTVVFRMTWTDFEPSERLPGNTERDELRTRFG